MAKVYFVRHQAHGVVYDYPFSASPTDDQKSLVSKRMFQLHGAEHPKLDADGKKKPYWTSVLEVEVLGPTDLPVVEDRVLGVAPITGPVATGVGNVSPAPASKK